MFDLLSLEATSIPRRGFEVSSFWGLGKKKRNKSASSIAHEEYTFTYLGRAFWQDETHA